MSLTSLMITTAIGSYLLGVLSLWPVTRRLHTDLNTARTQLLHDRLTGLRNREGLAADHHDLTHAGHTLITLLADIDGFKIINDTHGHQTGDELLTAVATRIGDLTDLYHGSAARLSGDEFAILIPASRHHAARVADTFHTVIGQPITTTSGIALTVTVSIGYTVASTDLTASLRAADVAMYHAKQAGTGQLAGYRPGMTVPARPPHQRRHLRDQGGIE